MDANPCDDRMKDDRGEAVPRAAKVRANGVRMARAGFSDLVLVCAKCARRQGLKKGALRKVLKRELKGRDVGSVPSPGKPRVVEVGCLGPCPKRSIAMATSESLAKRRIHLIGPEATSAQVVDALFPDFGPKGILTQATTRKRQP